MGKEGGCGGWASARRGASGREVMEVMDESSERMALARRGVVVSMGKGGGAGWGTSGGRGGCGGVVELEGGEGMVEGVEGRWGCVLCAVVGGVFFLEYGLEGRFGGKVECGPVVVGGGWGMERREGRGGMGSGDFLA